MEWQSSAVLLTRAGLICICIWVLSTLWKVLAFTLWRPLMIARWMRRQGFSGPPFHFIVGNSKEADKLVAMASAVPLKRLSHDFGHRTFPFYTEWSKVYGKNFYYYHGSEVRFCTLDPRAMKEMTVTELNHYDKTASFRFLMQHVLGLGGIVLAEGDEWARQRRVTTSAFNIEDVKDMGKSVMSPSVQSLIAKLEKVVADSGGSADINLEDYLGAVTKEIISRAAFGSSFEKGREGFESQEKLIDLVASPEARLMLLPGLRLVPTAINREIWRTRGKVGETLQNIIQIRRDSVKEFHDGAPNHGKDLLGVLLNAARTTPVQTKENAKPFVTWTDQHLVDQCRAFFVAGEVTSNLSIAWTLVLLADNPEWQQRVRAEVLEVFGNELPDPDRLHKLRSLGMVISEMLRLYPTSPIMTRVVKDDGVKLMGIPVPKGLVVTIPTLIFHRNPEIWGDDALVFKPERFAQGIANVCKDPFGYVPFSQGPHKCVGQAFAIQEIKIVVASLLTKFAVELSPSYRHEPVHRMVLYPKYGVPIVLTSL